MIENYSIEQEAEKIYSPQTFEYFKESYSCYKQGNYRAATVTIWSVIICDLIFKLQELKDVYEDSSASKILDKIKNHQTNSPYSSKWESELIDDVHTSTSLIDNVELNNLKFLQSQRNLSAHPNISLDNELNSPNKDTTRALLRMALEAVLCKPAFYTDKVISNIFSDLTKNSFISERNDRSEAIRILRKLLENKYLNHLKPKYEAKIFKAFWKLTFRTENPEAEKNRIFGLMFLEIVCTRAKFQISTEIASDKKYYSQISNKENIIGYLAYLIAFNDQIYYQLDEEIHLHLKNCYEKNEISTKTLGWFLADTADKHLNNFQKWVETDPKTDFIAGQFIAIMRIFDNDEWNSNVLEIASSYYANSGSYDTADKRFSNTISPLLLKFKKQDFIYLILKISDNFQCYSRKLAKEDHLKLIKLAISSGLDASKDLLNCNTSFKPHLEEILQKCNN